MTFNLRMLLLHLFIGCAGGAMLGAASVIAYWAASGDPIGPVAMFVGAVIGVLFLPVSGTLLTSRPLVPAAALVYGPTALGAVAASLLGNPLTSFGITLLLFLLMNSVAAFIIPMKWRPPHCCQQCGYDLRGAAHERCPECGAECSPLTEIDHDEIID